jgi:hypothetical protein
MRKPKRLQEINTADVRARNPRRRAELPSDPRLTLSSEGPTATKRSDKRHEVRGDAIARARTSRSVHRRVFVPNPRIGVFLLEK